MPKRKAGNNGLEVLESGRLGCMNLSGAYSPAMITSNKAIDVVSAAVEKWCYVL